MKVSYVKLLLGYQMTNFKLNRSLWKVLCGCGFPGQVLHKSGVPRQTLYKSGGAGQMLYKSDKTWR